MRSWTILPTLFVAALTLTLVAPAAFAADPPTKETVCDDGIDEDGDTVLDCADADCYDAPVCAPDGNPENNDKRCSDWIDNDSDGHVDCDDTDCEGPGVTVCKGSWDKQGKASNGGNGGSGGDVTDPNALPEIPEGQSFEDLVGKMGDIDGERNDFLCADGIDNDGDGRTDCADFGCRFDPAVVVCREQPGMRFSVVGFITQSLYFERPADEATGSDWDTRFSVLQLRAFGPMPFIQDSFFLVSMRAERTPRLTFAMFQIPVGGGHFININSGGGGLSSAPVRSAAKQLLINRPFYLYDAFQGGSGAAAEIYGPVTKSGLIHYRAFMSGGAGQFAGNVGGRFFTYDNTNFTWSLGGQLSVNLIGSLSRWDSPMLFTKVPTSLGATFGVKYDQRAQERYPAWNINATLRSGRLIMKAETYMKKELEFDSFQYAWNVEAGFLLVPKHLFLVADVGQFDATEMKSPPQTEETDIRQLRNQTQWRLGMHWYFWRNIGVLSMIYTDDLMSARESVSSQIDERERKLELTAQYRF